MSSAAGARDAAIAPTRLLFIVPSLAFGGAERQLVELVRALSRERYHITVVYLTGYRFPGESGFYNEVSSLPSVDLVSLERLGKYDLLGPIGRLAQIVRERRIDIVCGRLNFGAMLALVAARLTGRPVIADSIRDCGPDRAPVLWICRRLQAWFADYVVSNSSAGFLVRFGRMRTNFRVIPNIVDPRRFAAKSDETARLRKQLGLDRFRILVGMIASMTPFKDHEAFLDVASIVAKRVPDAGFVLVGDGPRRRLLEERSQKLGLSDRVVFLGARTDSDAITQIIDVAVLLTNYRVIQEGLPNAVLEAMACAKPVVATWGGGTPEAVEDERTGFLIRNNDVWKSASVVLRLLHEPKLRRQVGMRAREVILSRFTPQAGMTAYQQLFASLPHRGRGYTPDVANQSNSNISRQPP